MHGGMPPQEVSRAHSPPPITAGRSGSPGQGGGGARNLRQTAGQVQQSPEGYNQLRQTVGNQPNSPPAQLPRGGSAPQMQHRGPLPAGPRAKAASPTVAHVAVKAANTPPPVVRGKSRADAERAFRKFPSFGVSLASIMAAQQALFPDEPLPCVFVTLRRLVVDNGGLRSEGIFRLSGNLAEVDRLKAALNKGAFDVQYRGDPNAPACALKQWIGELSPPLLDDNMANQVMAPYRADSKVSAARLREELAVLPDVNRRLLEALLDLMRDVLSHAQDNRMTPASLSIVLSPNVFGVSRGAANAANPFAFMAETGEQSAWMQRMLTDM